MKDHPPPKIQRGSPQYRSKEQHRRANMLNNFMNTQSCTYQSSHYLRYHISFYIQTLPQLYKRHSHRRIQVSARERSSSRYSKIEETADEKAMSGIGQFVLNGVKILPNTNAIGKYKNSKHLKEDNSHSLTSHKLRQCQHFPPDSRLLSVRYINHFYY